MYISQCLIAKNEEKNIGYCLEHLKSVVDEQIVIDTCSTDRTIEIAKSLGAKVFHFEWINDFSAARNFAIDKAKGDWIIFLDCDEYFSEDSVLKLKKSMKMCSKDKTVDGIMCQMVNVDKDSNPIGTVKNISPRIFKNKKNLRYRNKVHETIYNSYLKGGNISVGDTGNDLIIYHTGYDNDIVADKNKIERNIEMIKSSVEENPEDEKMYYYLSNEYFRLKKYEYAIKYARESIAHKKKETNKFLYALVYRNILRSMHSMSCASEDIKKEFDTAVEQYPMYPDFYYTMGLTVLRENKLYEAIRYIEKCIELCESYNMDLESYAVADVEDVYTALIQANILSENKMRVVELCTAVLNANKYNYQILCALINTFLSGEKEENIFVFFKRIYDYSNFKDKLYLLKASEQNNSEKLVGLYREILTPDELKGLDSK